MHDINLLLMLAGGFIAALSLGYFTNRLGLSPIAGYLVAGVLVGPHTPGFVADESLASQLSEMGVILLMFGVGLHFHWKDLHSVGKVAIAGAICQSAIATGLGALMAHALGWSWAGGLVLGLALSVASTVVLIRVLGQYGQLHSATGRIAVGWLVVEDIFTVLLLVLLPVLFGNGGGQAGTAIMGALVKLSAFVAFTLVVGARAIPWLLNKIADSASRELFTLGVLAIAFGIAVGASTLFGVSMALGAFLAGMVVGQSDFSARAGAEALPMRDAFAVMFFLSTGMLFNPRQAFESPLLMFGTLAIILIGKPLAAFAIVKLMGYGTRIGLGVSVALAQIGEFSFLVGTLGMQLGVLPPEAMNPIVAGAIISITLNPLLYGLVPWLDRVLRRQTAPSPLPAAAEKSTHKAIVVGHGPIGKSVARLLRERGIQPVIVEMNIDTFRKLRADGHSAIYGDANLDAVLQTAGAAEAESLILSSSGSANFTEAIRNARRINPGIHIVTRADFLREAGSLSAAGANEVYSGEGEVALAITNSILRHLGATPEQLESEAARIRAELFQPTA